MEPERKIDRLFSAALNRDVRCKMFELLLKAEIARLRYGLIPQSDKDTEKPDVKVKKRIAALEKARETESQYFS